MGHHKVLFVNTNRFQYPPVIPVGIEYLVHVLRQEHFVVEVSDLCFAASPAAELESRITSFGPDAVCMTVRNIDSALYLNNEYFLPEIRGHVTTVRQLTDAPVVIGGAGLIAGPQSILQYTRGDCAVVGPAEEILPALLREPQLLRRSGKVIRGKLPSSLCPARAEAVDYAPYITQNGIPGFETHKGCTSHCGYCIEANTPVTFKDPVDVVCEVRSLVRKGFDHFHLCDSEFNEDTDYCIEVLTALVEEKLGMRWALYMKPGNFNKLLFNLLRESGAYLITLSVDTFERCPEYWQDVERMVFLARAHGIRISIDFLTGFPYEDEDVLKEALDLFRRVGPDEVVINVFLRIYVNTRLKSILSRDLSLNSFLLRNGDGDDSFLTPCFYNHIAVERLRELIRCDKTFRIAGEEKVVNYQKAI